MLKRTASILISILLFSLILTNCGVKDDTNAVDEQIYKEVTDLQLALLNNVIFQDGLNDLEGKPLEGHDELIDPKYKKNISGGTTLVDQLKGYKLVDLVSDGGSGFKAAVLTKGKNLVIVYGGTDDLWTDGPDDIMAGAFDYSDQDGLAKSTARDYARKFSGYQIYISGYSMGGRLCYLGAETVVDNGFGGDLKKVRTFNGLGVKEFLDFQDGNLSNIHSWQTKFADRTFDYIVKGDFVSDGDSAASLKYYVGYNHIGTEFRVPCTNKVDKWQMKQHDLYSIIDYLLNNPPPAENTSFSKKLDNKPVLVVTHGDHNLIGEFISVDGDIEVNTWNTFISRYPKAVDPFGQGRKAFSKMNNRILFLKDNEGNVLDCKGFMNPTGFGTDPCDWTNRFGEFDWTYQGKSDTYEDNDFYILYEGEYYSGPASCSIVIGKLREYVTLGAYEQDGNEENGKEPIDWLVLTQDDEKMLVVSKYCLDYLKYPDDVNSNISWETCSLRSFLNSDFIADVFSPEEQQAILPNTNQNIASKEFGGTVNGNPTEDKVFLLSIDEVQKYMPSSTASESSKRAYGTNYLYDKIRDASVYPHTENGEPVIWALRADIDISKTEGLIGIPREVVVNDSQIICRRATGGKGNPIGTTNIIRPAMWIKSNVPKHR